MNLYRVISKHNTAGVWAGSQSEAASLRKSLTDAGAKRADISTQTIEVPTNKAGLMAFLNRLEAGLIGNDE
jgi:hypothetical protein